MKIENLYYHPENEGLAKNFRDVSTNKWYWEHELILIYGKGVIPFVKKGLNIP